MWPADHVTQQTPSTMLPRAVPSASRTLLPPSLSCESTAEPSYRYMGCIADAHGTAKVGRRGNRLLPPRRRPRARPPRSRPLQRRLPPPESPAGAGLIHRPAGGPARAGLFEHEAAARPWSQRVICGAAVRVGQHCVGLADPLESPFGRRASGVGVRVMRAGKLAVGLLDGVLGRVVRNAEKCVEILAAPMTTGHGPPSVVWRAVRGESAATDRCDHCRPLSTIAGQIVPSRLATRSSARIQPWSCRDCHRCHRRSRPGGLRMGRSPERWTVFRRPRPTVPVQIRVGDLESRWHHRGVRRR